MSQVSNSIILITGGDSGLGKALVMMAHQKLARTIVIWGNDKQRLNEVAGDLKSKGLPVQNYLVDISNSEQVASAAARVIHDVGLPDIIINNAGIVIGKQFSDHSFKDIESSMQVNACGPMLVTNAFIKDIVKRKSGHIVNIASAAGLTPIPNMSVYAASKWAIIGWSESLRLELEMISKNLRVTTVTPSYINTGMFNGAKAPILTRMTRVEDVANAIILAIEKNKIQLRTPRTIYLLPILRGILPTRIFDKIIGSGFRIYSSMNNFKGRQ